MHHRLILLVICLLAAGCSMAVESTEPTAQKRDLTRVNQIELGMTSAQIQQILGDKVVVGYQKNDKAPQGVEPITLKNPTRVEILKVGSKVYNVQYYFIRVTKADGLIANDEMIPLVFDNDKLVGKTWDYLVKLRSKAAK